MMMNLTTDSVDYCCCGRGHTAQREFFCRCGHRRHIPSASEAEPPVFVELASSYSTACSLFKHLPRGGRFLKCHITRNRRHSMNRSKQPQTSRLKQTGQAKEEDRTGARGVKRLHSDTAQLECSLYREGDRLYEGSAPMPDVGDLLSDPSQMTSSKGAPSQPAMGTGYLRGSGSTQKEQHGACVFSMDAGPEEQQLNIGSDNAEEEAEIRAEVLDGARQLLQNESEIDCLVQLRMRLREKNTALLERAIHRRGVPECMELLEETLGVEAKGGQLTMDGRRRTPGGVFLRLLQDRIPREDKRFIWDEQNREKRKLKRQRIRSQKAAGGLASTGQQAKCNDASLATSKQAATEMTFEEREPGELSAEEVEPLDRQWTK